MVTCGRLRAPRPLRVIQGPPEPERAPPGPGRTARGQPAGTIAVVTQIQSASGPAPSVDQRIADELGVAVRQVRAAVELLDGGATVPFIARYRKEATGTLDDAQLRTLEERLRYLRELDERRDAILIQITAQGKLTGELEAQIRAADSKARLEDLYLPFKQKRRTKGMIAREEVINKSQDPTTIMAKLQELELAAGTGVKGKK